MNLQKVFVIDDEQLNHSLLEFVLQKHQLAYFGALDSRLALESVKHIQPDLILMDIVMPHINGFELCKAIKSDFSIAHIPVIFITSKTSVTDNIEGFNAGAVDFVTKPFQQDELIARIKTHITISKSKIEAITRVKNLQQSNILKDEVFAILGHDLKSPLSALKFKLDLIQRGVIDSKSSTFNTAIVPEMSATTDEVLYLLENLLGWAKTTSDVLHMHFEKIAIQSVIEETLRVLKMNIQLKNITIKLDVPRGLMAYADYKMTKTIIRNLVSNAIKFTPINGHICIAVKQVLNRIEISVADNGIGMDPEELSHILNGYQNYSREGTEKEQGTGLGLVICQEFAKKHKGQLKIQSVPHKGSEFTFDLASA